MFETIGNARKFLQSNITAHVYLHKLQTRMELKIEKYYFIYKEGTFTSIV